jgi:non-heme chloroperoxidase
MLSSKLVKRAELLIYSGGSHGICTTEKDRINADLLAFMSKAKAGRRADAA